MIKLIVLLLTVIVNHLYSQDSDVLYSSRPLDAVMLTTYKDSRVFEKSIQSALNYLIDINKFYIITPNAVELSQKFNNSLYKRVIFIDEITFPFTADNVATVMIDTVRERNVYPLDNGKSPFEKTVFGRIGWFLQQLLKLTAGTVLNLHDYVLLDSDIIWFHNISLLANTNNSINSYYYTSSSQWHGPYVATVKRISGVGLPLNQIHRSGITHHLVIVKHVMENLIKDSMELHNNISFWKILANESAIELTCKAPKLGICGGGSTLSEYELYFQYARQKHPETMVFRPLLWANGPSPGLLFWPQSDNIESDGPKRNWLHHRQNEVDEVFDKQILADKLQGYDFIGYHGYAQRRYFELVDEDQDILCKNMTEPFNSTCSWKGLDISNRSEVDWFQACGCYMANHQSGP